jgi:hypothetical protein
VSTFAAARVETKIVLQGEGNAAKAVKETRDQLDGMGASAKKATGEATGGFTQFATIASQKLSGLGGAISGINAVLGGTSPALQKIGQGFTAAGAVANLLPGPIGLTAAAVTGLAVATYAFVKAANEADAKTRFMRGGAGSEGLAERVGVTQDAILGMQQSMEELSARGLAPTEASLIAVRQRAEAMGRDGAKAVGDFVAALAKGPEALRALQAQIGDLGVGTTEELAKQLNLSLETIGAAKSLTDIKQKAKDIEAEYAVLLAERSLLEKRLTEENAEAQKRYGNTVTERIKAAAEAQQRLNAAQPQLVDLDARIDRTKAQAAAIEQAARSERDQAVASTAAKTRAAQLEVQASVTRNANVAVGLRLQAVDERIGEVMQRQVLLAGQRANYSAAEFTNREEALKLELAQAEAAKTQLIEADKAAQKAKREASAAKAKEARQAERDAVIELAKAEEMLIEQRAQDPSIDPAVLQAKLKIIELEEGAAVRAARARVNTAKGREIQIRAIEMTAQANRKKEIEDAKKAVEDAAREEVELRRSAFEDALQVEVDARAQITELQREQQASIAEGLRQRGRFTEATLVEIRQAEADHAAAVLKIQRELDVALTGIDAESDSARELRRLANVKIEVEQQKLAEKTTEAYRKQNDAILASFNAHVDAIQNVVGTSIGKSNELVASAFGKQIEQAQNALDGLEGDAAKKGKEQVKLLQDQAKEAARLGGAFDVLGGSVGTVAKNVRSGFAAWKEYDKAANTGNVEAMQKALSGVGSALDGTISASGAAAAAFVDDEKSKAAILAITETAASIAAFATGNVPGGIAHAASAAIYAGVAGGAIPSGGAGGATAAGGEAATTGGGTVAGTAGQAGAGGGGVTQVFNFNKGFIFGSQQEVAKGISGTLRSIGGTGYDKRKAV